MPTLKWLFRPVNIIVFIVLLLLFVNRHALFSTQEGESEQVKQLLSRVDGVVERMDGAANGKLQEEPPNVTDPLDTVPSVPPAGEEPADVPQLVVQPDSGVEESPSSSEEAAALEGDSPRLSLQATGSQQDTDDSSAVGATVNEQVPAAVGSQQSDDPYVLLEMSRQAAWVGDFESAAEHYRALLLLQPQNYDAHGELGNVLLQMGDTAGAVGAYSESARLLLRAGYPQAAWQVMMLVSRIDPRKGYELDQSLRNAYAATTPTQ